MFVRIRGKGACPENSQAAVMHIRGFRHTHSAAPPESFYPLFHESAAHAEASASPTAAPASVEMRPFRFPLFPFGIHAATLTEAQAKFMSRDTTAAAAADAAVVSPVTALDNEVARMVWKETWNLYDILYDEVPLLPWTESTSDAFVVAETVEAELHKLATSSSGDGAALASLASLENKTDNFKLASARTGNQQVVVCPHYYASAALPESAFTHIQRNVRTTAVPAEGPVVVLDVSDLPISLAGGKAMVNIAWCAAFAAMQPDSALLRCRAVVVRLPYTIVPTYAQAAQNIARGASTANMANAFVELVDFIGEHITAVRHAMVRELRSVSAALAEAHASAPPVHVIGSTPDAMSACVRSVVAPAAGSSSDVVVFFGDHHLVNAAEAEAETASSAAHVVGLHKAVEYQTIGEACDRAVTVETVVVPLKALLDGGEEAWDPYTLRERQRLNFCPCCGDCGNEAESAEGADHGHSHGHGHHHH